MAWNPRGGGMAEQKRRYVQDTEARLADCLRLRKQGKLVYEIAAEVFGVEDLAGVGRVQALLSNQPRRIRFAAGELGVLGPVQSTPHWQHNLTR